MVDWIEINLPYYLNALDVGKIINLPQIPTYPKYEFEKQAKQHFGWHPNDLIIDFDNNKFLDYRDKIEKELVESDPNEKMYKYEGWKNYSSNFYQDVDTILKTSTDADIIKGYQYHQKIEDFHNWITKNYYPAFKEEQSKIIKERDKLVNQYSFYGRGLAKPGTLIEIELNKQLKTLLIGDIVSGSQPDEDSYMVDDKFNKSIVKRYKIIYSHI